MGKLKVWTIWKNFTEKIEPGCTEPPPGWTFNPAGHATYEWDRKLPETLVKPQLVVQQAVGAGQLVWEVAEEGAEPKPTKEFHPDVATIWVLAPIAGG